MTGEWNTTFSGYAEDLKIKAVLGNANAITAVATGAIIKDCVLVSSGTGNCFDAPAAATIKIYGTVTANAAKGANVTVQVGTLTVDANVTLP